MTTLPEEIACDSMRGTDRSQMRRRCPGYPGSVAAAARSTVSAWQLWHIARWDDRFAQIIAELATGLRTEIAREQVWERASIREQWGWGPNLELGRREAGTGLTEEQAAALPFPTSMLFAATQRRRSPTWRRPSPRSTQVPWINSRARTPRAGPRTRSIPRACSRARRSDEGFARPSRPAEARRLTDGGG